MRKFSILLLGLGFALTSAADDEVFRSVDGSQRVTARERSPGVDALYDERGRLLGYRRGDADDSDHATITDRDGSRRLYLRERSDDTAALVNDEGRVVGYRKKTSDNRWRYTAPDGKTLGYSEKEKE